MKLLRERPNSRVKHSMLICALFQRNMLLKRNFLPSVDPLDIWSSNAFTRPVKKRIGRVEVFAEVGLDYAEAMRQYAQATRDRLI